MSLQTTDTNKRRYVPAKNIIAGTKRLTCDIASGILEQPGDYDEVHWKEGTFMIETKTSKPSIDWKFWLLWTFATIFGLILGIAISLSVIIAISKITNIHEDTITNYIILPIIGFSVGIFQWLMLRKHVSWARMWIWLTTAGWVISFLLAFSLYNWLTSISGTEFTDTWQKAIQFTLIAIFIGGFQWLLLKRHISRSGWWILANVIGWNAVGLLAGAGAMVSVLESIPMGISVGAVTGLALTWLLQQSPADPGTTILETSTA